jgi:hypothetical protein
MKRRREYYARLRNEKSEKPQCAELDVFHTGTNHNSIMIWNIIRDSGLVD